MTENQRTYLLIGIAAISVILTRIPLIGKYFRGFYTLIHEMAHALLAVITSGKVISIELFSNTEGKTTSAVKGWFSRFLVSIAGYPVASVTAFLFISAIAGKHETMVLWAILIINLICLLLFIRNLYGFFWLLIMSAICAFPLYLHNPTVILAVVTGLTAILLWESVIAAVTLVVLSLKDGSAAGDATSLKELTFLPAFFWAVLFSVNSAYWAYRSYQVFIAQNSINL